MYRVGIPASERPRCTTRTSGATQRVLEAAIATGGAARSSTSRPSTSFGNTHGQIVDETYRRDLSRGLPELLRRDQVPAPTSRARERIGSGAPIVIAMPGTTYGPGDHSAIGSSSQLAYDGRCGTSGLTDVGISPGHVDDLAAGIVAALDRGPDRRVVHPGRREHAPARGDGDRRPARWPSAAAARPSRPVCSAPSRRLGADRDRSSSASRRTSARSSRVGTA